MKMAMERISSKKLLEQYLSLVKKLLPEREGTFSTGIDIGFHSCKMVEISKAGNTFQLNSFAIEPVLNGNMAEAVKAVLTKVRKIPDLRIHRFWQGDIDPLCTIRACPLTI